MASERNSPERFKKIVHKHTNTIKAIAANFYVPNTYQFNELVTDLTTHLWLLYRDVLPEKEIYAENALVYSVLRNKALNIVRNEQRYQKHFIYNIDLSELSDNPDSLDSLDTPEHHPDTEQFYRLITRLDEKDQEMIYMYLDGIPIKEIADLNNKSLLHTYQHLHYLRKKLRTMNKTNHK